MPKLLLSGSPQGERKQPQPQAQPPQQQEEQHGPKLLLSGSKAAPQPQPKPQAQTPPQKSLIPQKAVDIPEYNQGPMKYVPEMAQPAVEETLKGAKKLSDIFTDPQALRELATPPESSPKFMGIPIGIPRGAEMAAAMPLEFLFEQPKNLARIAGEIPVKDVEVGLPAGVEGPPRKETVRVKDYIDPGKIVPNLWTKLFPPPDRGEKAGKAVGEAFDFFLNRPFRGTKKDIGNLALKVGIPEKYIPVIETLYEQAPNIVMFTEMLRGFTRPKGAGPDVSLPEGSLKKMDKVLRRQEVREGISKLADKLDEGLKDITVKQDVPTGKRSGMEGTVLGEKPAGTGTVYGVEEAGGKQVAAPYEKFGLDIYRKDQPFDWQKEQGNPDVVIIEGRKTPVEPVVRAEGEPLPARRAGFGAGKEPLKIKLRKGKRGYPEEGVTKTAEDLLYEKRGAILKPGEEKATPTNPNDIVIIGPDEGLPVTKHGRTDIEIIERKRPVDEPPPPSGPSGGTPRPPSETPPVPSSLGDLESMAAKSDVKLAGSVEVLPDGTRQVGFYDPMDGGNFHVRFSDSNPLSLERIAKERDTTYFHRTHKTRPAVSTDITARADAEAIIKKYGWSPEGVQEGFSAGDEYISFSKGGKTYELPLRGFDEYAFKKHVGLLEKKEPGAKQGGLDFSGEEPPAAIKVDQGTIDFLRNSDLKVVREFAEKGETKELRDAAQKVLTERMPKKKPAPKQKTETILQWLRRRGVWDEKHKGEIKRILGSKEGGFVGIERRNGASLDDLLTELKENRQMPEDATVADMIDFIDEQVSLHRQGEKTYIGDIGDVTQAIDSEVNAALDKSLNKLMDYFESRKKFIGDETGGPRKKVRGGRHPMKEEIDAMDAIIRDTTKYAEKMGRKGYQALRNKLKKAGFTDTEITKILMFTGKKLTKEEQNYLKTYNKYPEPYKVGDTVHGQTVVRKVKTGAEPIYEGEMKVLKNAPKMKPITGKFKGIKQLFGEQLKNPIYTFDELGEPFKQLTWDRLEDAELNQVKEMEWNVRKKIKAWKDQVGRSGGFRIAKHLIGRQEGGMGKLMEAEKNRRTFAGIKLGKSFDFIPYDKLTAAEKQVIKAFDDMMDITWQRINEARLASGKDPIPKRKDYYTFFTQLDYLDRMGFDPININNFDALVNKHFKAPNSTVFRHELTRTKNNIPVSTDFFNTVDRYMDTATKHIHLGPEIYRIRQYLKPMEKDGKIVFDMRRDNPRLALFLHEHLNQRAGVKVTDWGYHTDNTIMTLAKNASIAMLSGNLRSAGIQISALRNVFPRVGWRAFSGMRKTLSPYWRKYAMEHSNLIARKYDLTVEDFLDSLEGMKKGVVKFTMKPLQFIDMQTAMGAWHAFRDHAIEVLGKSEKDAIHYANDLVIKTQASGRVGHVAPFQTRPTGKFLAALQTFVINDMNHFAYEVLGINRSLPKRAVMKKVMWFIGATTAFNILFEDILNVNSPFGTPVREYIKQRNKGKSQWEALQKAALEAADIIPIISSARFGNIFGAGAQAVQDSVDMVFGSKNPKYLPETIAKLRGWPLVLAISKFIRNLDKGMDPVSAALGMKERESEGGKIVE